MNARKLILAQLTAHLPLTFRRCIARYKGEHKIKSFTCLEHFLIMLFAQRLITVARTLHTLWRKTDRSNGVICDRMIALTVFSSK